MKSLGKTAMNFPAAFFELDHQGCILTVNSFGEELTGLPSAELSGKSWLLLAIAQERPELEIKWQSFCSSSEFIYQTHFTPDLEHAQIDWLQIRIARSAQGFSACLENHSQLKQIQQSNFHLREKLAALFRNSNQMIVMLDRQHRITEFNHVAALSAQQRFFKKMEVGENFTNYVQPDRMADFHSSFALALQGQNVFKERVIHAPDGDGLSYEMNYFPIKDKDGLISGVCFSGFDIAAQKQTQQLLHAEQSFVSAILDTSSALILVLDGEGKIERFNRACETLSGYRLNDIKGQFFDFLLAPEQRSELVNDFSKLQTTVFPRQFKLQLLTSTGELPTISWTVTALMNMDNRLEYLVATGIDITESEKTAQTLREQEEVLRQTQKLDAVGQLAGEVAHDFNNILAGIQGYAQLLEENVEPETESGKYVLEIQRIAQKARNLTGQLLIFSRKNRPNPRSVLIPDIIEQMQPLFKPLLGESVHLEIKHAANLPAILIEPTHLEQLLMNLIVNARDAMERKGLIQIETSLCHEPQERFVPLFGALPAGDYVRLDFRDQGPGIPIEIREKIFNPFFTTKSEGTGLGLAIVYGVVKEYGGFIQIESSEQGAQIQVYFPAFDDSQTKKSPVFSKIKAIGLLNLNTEENSLITEIAGQEIHLHHFTNFEAYLALTDKPALLLAELNADNLKTIQAYLYADSERHQHLQVLYFSGHEEHDLNLLDQLKDAEDALIRPIGRYRLQKWLQQYPLHNQP
jgi:PAS domain S-box-containing protein